MNRLRDQRGAILPYVLMVSAVLLLFVPVLLNMTTTKKLANISNYNQKLAYNLSVTGMESFISYIHQFPNDGKTSKSTYFYNYFSNYKTNVSITTPEGVPVQYNLTYSPPSNNIVTVTSTAIVGSGIYQKTNSIKYTFDLSTQSQPPGTYIDPNNRVAVPVNSNQIYVQGTNNTGIPKSVKVINNTSLQSVISNQINAISSSITNQVQSLQSRVINYASVYKTSTININSKSDMDTFINNINSLMQSSTSFPAVIQIGDVTINDNSQKTFSLGSSSKPVILLFNSLTLNSNIDLTVYGSLITQSFDSNNNLNLYIKASNSTDPSQGNFYILDTQTTQLNNTISISVDNMLYTNSNLNTNNSASITAKTMVVNGTFTVNNNLNLTVGLDLYTKELATNNNAQITATNGDIFVSNNFQSNNNTQVTAGGNIAIGGNITFNNNTTIQNGGGTTSLIVNNGSGGNNGGNGGTPPPNWNITKQ